MDGKSAPRVTALIVPGGPDAWERAGFACDEAGFGAGDVEVRFDPAVDRGLIWLEGPTQDRHPGADGAGAAARPGPVARELPVRHPNGVTGVDHIVVATPDPERTRAALEDEGLECRRVRRTTVAGREIEQGFHPAGSCLIEVVGPDGRSGEERAAVWGVTFVTPELDRLAARRPQAVASIRDAVQPGRRIATALTEAGLPIPVAFMDPRTSS